MQVVHLTGARVDPNGETRTCPTRGAVRSTAPEVLFSRDTRGGIDVASEERIMQTPLQITFRGITPSEPIESYVRTRADRLERFFDRITGCHVMIETPHRHKRHGHHHRVRIDLVVPGDELVVMRDPPERKDQEDLYASIDAAFDDAQRRLEDHVRMQRGDVKRRETPTRHGRVAKLYSYEGYGFLATPEGDEVYFHRNSVLHRGFDRLTIGTRVRFVEETGDNGPQASTVAVVD